MSQTDTADTAIPASVSISTRAATIYAVAAYTRKAIDADAEATTGRVTGAANLGSFDFTYAATCAATYEAVQKHSPEEIRNVAD